MVTIYDLLAAVGTGGGLFLGARLGYQQFGVVGTLLGALLGAVIGFLVGRVPRIITNIRFERELHVRSVTQLRERLYREYFVSHELLNELISRGEPAEDFREYVARQLKSDRPYEPNIGKYNARTWFPELVETN